MSENTSATERTFEALDVETCMRLLERGSFGRIAHCSDDRVEILPVNYVFFEGSVVIRTGFGDRLDQLADGPPASFQVDEIDHEDGTGWSVVVQGTTEEVSDPGELARLRELDIDPWAPGDRDHFVRVLPSRITGRRLQLD